MRYIVEPEVPGELGELSILDTSVHPPIVKRLHFVLYGWLGDDLIECFPVYLVSETLKSKILKSNLIGYDIKDCKIDISDEFKEMQPHTFVPRFYWLDINGKENDDFQLANKRLVISEAAYLVINSCKIGHATINRQ